MATLASPTIDHAKTGTPTSRPSDERLTRVLESRRAVAGLAGIVFLTTLVQVLANPATGLFTDLFSWTHALPIGVVAALAALLTALQSASLLIAARRPRLALLGTVAGYLAMVALLVVPDWASGLTFVVAVASFLLSARTSLREASLWFVIAAVVGLGGIIWMTISTGTPPGIAVAFVLREGMSYIAPVAGVTALGVWWGARTRRVEDAQAEVEAARREQDERLEQARVQERMRIAQELHDVAGQHVAGLLSIADLALDLEIRDVAQAVAIVEEIRVEGRFASVSLLAALRDLRAIDGARGGRTPDLQEVPELVAYWHRLGAKVDSSTRGDVSELPAMVSASAYRVLQESLTNAAKHAPGARVSIDIVADEEWLRVVVANEAPAPSRVMHESVGLGWGLEGMTARVRLLGGTVEAGPTPGGGWKVEMSVPVVQIEMPSSLAG